MKKTVVLSILCASCLLSNEIELEKIEIKSELNSTILKDVSGEELKNADLADALSKNIPSIFMVKRSGIANDIILRGQKKDNINILIDDAKIYGACPNRMDPAISHVLTNNIKSVKVIEGPYDVENFGTLSGLVQIETKEPQEGFTGDVNVNVGSFGYKKASATLSGGTKDLKLLLSTSLEEGDQYEDGNGDNFLAQQKKQGMMLGNQYKDDGLEAFEKWTVMTKGIYNLNDKNSISLGYTANRSDTILYGAGPMDADYDDSDIYTAKYEGVDLAKFSKLLKLEYYYSAVDHPMSNKLRNSGQVNYSTNHLKTSIWGAKASNMFEVANTDVTLGVDTSTRNWQGKMYNTTVSTGVKNFASISLSDTDTQNKALFGKVEKSFGKFDIDFGARYDNTDVQTVDTNLNDKKYVSFNANVLGTYNASEDTRYYLGFGKSSRVPDARELYIVKGATGNDELKQTQNYEIDTGFETTLDDFFIKTNLFYSNLKDFIYNSGSAGFENIDAKIYGLDISGVYFATDTIYLDYGLAYQRGKKDGNYVDDNLPEIPPLKFSASINYDNDSTKLSAQVVAVDRWDHFDSSAKEQELAGYAVVNLKYNQVLVKGFDITFGVDNLLDKTYASTNTYQDIVYATVGGEPTLFNDTRRYLYANLRYQF